MQIGGERWRGQGTDALVFIAWDIQKQRKNKHIFREMLKGAGCMKVRVGEITEQNWWKLTTIW